MERDEGNQRSLLQEKIQELMRTKEELNRAKDEATQSWLDSRPLIDELERLKQELEDAEKQSSMSRSAVSELESELIATNKAIREKKEEELEASKMINETTLAIDRTRDELEDLKRGKHKEHRVRSRHKQAFRLKKHTLRSLQLGLRAVRMESEAVGASAAKAVHYISISDTDDTVQLTEEEYYDMQRREKEESSLANWRISVAEEQKLAAEESRKKAIVRLKEVKSKKRSRKVKEKGSEDEETEGGRRCRSLKEKGIADEETEGGKGYWGVKQKILADEDKEGEKGSRRAKYEGLVDEETEAEIADGGDLSSQGNELINTRPFASASMTPRQAFRSSSRTFTTRKKPSILSKIKTSCTHIKRMFGLISTPPCHRQPGKHS